jgi:hypothetical protein
MSAADILARIRRLDQLSRGLAKEIQLVERADDPMWYIERKEYLTAIRKVRAGIEDALVLLVKAKQRPLWISRTPVPDRMPREVTAHQFQGFSAPKSRLA